MTQSFVFPFTGFSSMMDSPSDPWNLNFISDIMPSETFNVTIPLSDILSGPFIRAKEYPSFSYLFLLFLSYFEIHLG